MLRIRGAPSGEIPSTRILKSHTCCVHYCFSLGSRIFHSYRDVTISGEGLQNLGLCSALMVVKHKLKHKPYLQWHGASIYIFIRQATGNRTYFKPDPKEKKLYNSDRYACMLLKTFLKARLTLSQCISKLKVNWFWHNLVT